MRYFLHSFPGHFTGLSHSRLSKETLHSNSESDLATSRWPTLLLFRTYSKTSHGAPCRQVSLIFRTSMPHVFVDLPRGTILWPSVSALFSCECCIILHMLQTCAVVLMLFIRISEALKDGNNADTANSHGLLFQSCLNQLHICRPHQAYPCPPCITHFTDSVANCKRSVVYRRCLLRKLCLFPPGYQVLKP